MTEQLAAEVFLLASEAQEVPACELAAVAARAREQGRRRRRAVIGGIAAGVLVVGGVAWLSTTGEEDRAPTRLEVVPARNPVDAPWFANGRLHLDRVQVRVAGVTDLAALTGGAVYATEDGTVAFVAADGDRRVLGTKDADSTLVASIAAEWAAWVKDGVLHVYDVAADVELGTRRLRAPDARVLAIDQERVYVEDGAADYVWTPGLEPTRLQEWPLVDVHTPTRVVQRGRRIEMDQSFFNVTFRRPGVGAQISPGGTYVLSRDPRDEGERTYRPLLYDARSGERLPSGIGPGERAVDATFGQNTSVTYLVAQLADLTGGADLDGNIDPLLVLRTCDVETAVCSDLVPVPSSTDRALLGR